MLLINKILHIIWDAGNDTVVRIYYFQKMFEMAKSAQLKNNQITFI